MNKILNSIFVFILSSVVILSITNCKKSDNPIRYQSGIFPDTVINLSGINSAYDDYNSNLFQLGADVPIVFSSNRGSQGGQFDFVQGIISYNFDQGSGDFFLESAMIDDPFYRSLIKTVNTAGDDFGPYGLYSPADGYEYLILSSVNTNGDLDFYFARNVPYFGTSAPLIEGPFPVSLLNTASNDAYISFDTKLDSAYFSSDAEGNFNIYFHTRSRDASIFDWLIGSYEASSPVDGVNSSNDDKCPFVYKDVMVFASDREGGFGGFDLYYSLFKEGKWSAPVNFGASINTPSNEYRPVIAGCENFQNQYMVFSSDRPGGLGEFDLYFAGVDFSE